jgi:hypothetical protein
VERDAAPVGGHRALHACISRPGGERPATSPPQGALVMHPTTARSPRSSPCPASAHSSRRRAHGIRAGRSARSRCRARTRRSLVEHDPVGDAAAVTDPRMSGGELGALVGACRSARRTLPAAAR